MIFHSGPRFRILWIALCACTSSPLFMLHRQAGADDPKAVGEQQLFAWWVDLEKDEPEATQALLEFAVRPKQATAFLKDNLKPLKIDSTRVKSLLFKLGSTNEKVWKPAFEELEYFDPRLAIDLPQLMELVTETPARQRMVEVMCGHDAGELQGKDIQLRNAGAADHFNFFAQNTSWWAERKVARLGILRCGNYKKKWTRAVRAIVLLERIGTPDAVAIIKDMASGHVDAQPTKMAQQSLVRLGASKHGGIQG
jgi:hypothetical protein